MHNIHLKLRKEVVSMKLFLSTAIVTGSMMMAATAFAMIPSSEIALDGVAPGMSVDEAVAIYGQATYRGDDAYFPNGVKADLDDFNRNLIEELKINRPGSGVATPAGIAINSPESAIVKAYGKPDKLEYDDGKNEYTYYASDSRKKLKIEAMNGVVVKIKCDLYD